MRYIGFRWLLLITCTLLTACMPEGATNPQDPLEPTNRAIYQFNKDLDRILIKPLAQSYKTITPPFIDRIISRAFSNLGEVDVIINDLLQLRLRYALEDSWRFTLNSTIGLAGCFDVAKNYDLPHRQQNFGLTLKTWGLPPGDFMILPILGSTSSLDILGLPLDLYFLDPVTWLPHQSNTLRVLRGIDHRADSFPLDRIIQNAFDPYIFTRNAYQQQQAAAFKALNETAHASQVDAHIPDTP